MLTTQEIDSLPPGMHHNSFLRKKFGTKHGSPVKFQDEKGKVHTFVSNRWWKRYRKSHPLKRNPKNQNINTEFGKVYGKSKNINWLSKLLLAFKKFFS